MNNFSLPVLFEDEYLIAIDKPPNMHSAMHPEKINDSVAKRLAEEIPGCRQASARLEDAGLIHRLDYETSGVIIAAKSRQIWEALRSALKSGKISKRYLILVEGVIEPTTVKTYLGARGRQAKKVRVYRDQPRDGARVLEAETIFESAQVSAPSDEFSFALASATSATRHQVRAHAAYLGHPLLGDALYGSTKELSKRLPQYSNRAFVLDACKVTFEHPLIFTAVSIESAFFRQLVQ